MFNMYNVSEDPVAKLRERISRLLEPSDHLYSLILFFLFLMDGLMKTLSPFLSSSAPLSRQGKLSIFLEENTLSYTSYFVMMPSTFPLWTTNTVGKYQLAQLRVNVLSAL